MPAAIGLFCVNREVDGIEVTVFKRDGYKRVGRGKKGAYGVLEREISTENRFFPLRKSRFLKVPVSGIF